MTGIQKRGAGISCTMMLWTSLAFAANPTIDSAIVNLSTNEITIGGTHLIPSSGPPVVMLEAVDLTLLSSTNTKIVANLPGGLADGTYRLSVNNGSSTVAVIGIAIGAGSLALPYNGSALSASSVLNVTNTGPGGNTTAVSGQGGASSAGSGNQGGTGVGAYGGNSSGGGSVGGTGLYARGGSATATPDIAGKGLSAYGGYGASGTSTGGGPGLWATGGTAGSAGGQGGDGIDAFAGTSTGNGYPSDALYAVQNDQAGYAGEFIGNVIVAGNLAKSGGSFRIDDPIDPANKYLYHSFVESPDMKNVYDGNVVTDGGGSAIILLVAAHVRNDGNIPQFLQHPRSIVRQVRQVVAAHGELVQRIAHASAHPPSFDFADELSGRTTLSRPAIRLKYLAPIARVAFSRHTTISPFAKVSPICSGISLALPTPSCSRSRPLTGGASRTAMACSGGPSPCGRATRLPTHSNSNPRPGPENSVPGC